METAGRGAILLALGTLVGACSGAEVPPLNVDGGVGSQFGTYAAEQGDEMVIDGQPCRLFNWDRPLSAELMLRVTSASCPSRQRPVGMVCTDVGRKLLPLAATADGSGIR